MPRTAALPETDLPVAVARARYVHITPMKARRVIDLIRGMSAEQALAVLQFAPQAAGEQVRKVVASAVANAENNDRLDRDDLVVTEAYVDEGPTIKRFRPRAQGRAYRIRKRTCHITVVVTAHPKDDKPVKRTGVARLTKKASRPGTKKASPAKATKATKATPAKATKSTGDAKAAKTSTSKASKAADSAKTGTTSTSDKDASGTSKRRAH